MMKVTECAAILGKSPQFVRIGLQLGVLPFGYAVKMSNRWTYHISEKQLFEYVDDVRESEHDSNGSA